MQRSAVERCTIRVINGTTLKERMRTMTNIEIMKKRHATTEGKLLAEKILATDYDEWVAEDPCTARQDWCNDMTGWLCSLDLNDIEAVGEFLLQYFEDEIGLGRDISMEDVATGFASVMKDKA